MLVDLPVVEGHALLTCEDPEALLDFLRAGCDRPLTTQGRRQVVDAARSSTARAVRHLDRAELFRPAFAQQVRRGAPGRFAFSSGERGLRCRASRSAPSLLHGPLDVGSTGRERPQHAPGYVSQLAQTVAPDVPGEAKRCQLGPECGPVERPAGHLPGEEVPTVGGGQATVGALDQVGDDDVSVQLGIPGPTGAMPERGADEAVGLNEVLPVTSWTGVAGLFGEVVEHRGDGPVVGGGDRLADLVRSERPEERDPFGGRERQVVAGASLGSELDPEAGTIGCRARKQVAQHVGIDLADQAEPFGGSADPLSWCLAAPEVVVVDAVGNLVEVVLGATCGAEPPYREHRRAQRSTHRDRSTLLWSG